jgi:hypothetical protein
MLGSRSAYQDRLLYPEKVAYEPGDYAIITHRTHPFHGHAVKIIGVQKDLFATVSVGTEPPLPETGSDLHAVLVEPHKEPRLEMILRSNWVKKIEKR